jgi:hypothetical protein
MNFADAAEPETSSLDPAFRDVWAVRTLLVQESVLPPLETPAAYGFAVEI